MTVTGIQNGAVLQRDTETNTCHVFLRYTEDASLSVNKGVLSELGDGRFALGGIPVGGPYELVFSNGSESVSFSDIYVGDLWLLAGQSNMEGAGRRRETDCDRKLRAKDEVRAYYFDDSWSEAMPDLHMLWQSNDPAHVEATENNLKLTREKARELNDRLLENHVTSVGPGYFIGHRLFADSAVPQGLIPTAIGGAPIEMWCPPEDGTHNYYTAACRRIVSCGGNIRGIFWYQGEGFDGDPRDYTKMFERMRDGFSALCHKSVIPTVQVQLCRCTIPDILRSPDANFGWSRMRDHQLRMADELPLLSTVATNDLDLDDCIHLSANSQEILGKRCANAMEALIKTGSCTEPKPESVSVIPDWHSPQRQTVCITYKNVNGELVSAGIPSGFSLSEGDNAPDLGSIHRITLSGNRVYVRTEYTREQTAKMNLWYGFGHSVYCNIQSEDGRAIPSFGPFPLGEALIETTEE